MAGIVRAGESEDLVVVLDIQRALAGATTFVAEALGAATDLDGQTAASADEPSLVTDNSSDAPPTEHHGPVTTTAEREAA
jgi:hypothetical protein